MRLGAMTHFAQGWNVSALDNMLADGIMRHRDEIQWHAVETSPGVYVQTQRNIDYQTKALANGITTLVILGFDNTLYDNGDSPYTAAGRTAYADYCVNTLATFPQVTTVEIWNEYNGGTFVDGPATADKPLYYTLMLQEAYTAIKSAYPNVTVIAGGTILIPIPYFRALFDHGAIAYCDAVSVHAYRDYPEGVKDEVETLKALTASYNGGVAKPVYVTEFGRPIDGTIYKPSYFTKMSVMLAAARVIESYWYLLRDTGSFTNWGLYSSTMVGRPVLQAYKYLSSIMSNNHIPARITNVGPTAVRHRLQLWKIKNTYTLAWSNDDMPVTFGGTFTCRDVLGNVIPTPTMLTNEPVLIIGDFLPTITAGAMVFDHRVDWGRPEWSYFSRSSTNVYTALTMQPTAGLYNDHLGISGDANLTVNATQMHPGGSGRYAVSRYTAPAAATGTLTTFWDVKSGSSNGINAEIKLNGVVIMSQVVLPNAPLTDVRAITLAVGDVLEFGTGANGSTSFDSTSFSATMRL